MEHNEIIPNRETALEMLLGAAAAEPARRPCQGAQQPMNGKIITLKQSTPGPTRIDGRQQPCRCGSCKACVGNARWERVFNEKFADADYYGGLRLSSRSPLAGL